MESNSKVYKEIKLRMKEKKMSYDELAERTSLSKTGVYNMIRKNSFKVETLKKICEVLDIKTSMVYEFESIDFKEASKEIAKQNIYGYTLLAIYLFDLKIDKWIESKDNTKGYIKAMFEHGVLDKFVEDLEKDSQIIKTYNEVKKKLKKY